MKEEHNFQLFPKGDGGGGGPRHFFDNFTIFMFKHFSKSSGTDDAPPPDPHLDLQNIISFRNVKKKKSRTLHV